MEAPPFGTGGEGMTLRELFRKVMVVLDEMDGNDSEGLGNFADYAEKIYEAAESCQREVAVYGVPIPSQGILPVVERNISLPEDCFRVLRVEQGEKALGFDQVREKVLLLPEGTEGDVVVWFYAYPPSITKETPLDTILTVSLAGQEAMVYGIAAMLTINDEPDLYVTYMERYNGLLTLLQQMRERNQTAKMQGGVAI